MKTLKTLIRLALWQGVSLLLLLYTGARLPINTPSVVLNPPASHTQLPKSSLLPTPRSTKLPQATQIQPSPLTNVPTNNESPTPDPRCIIIVDGGRYDVTTFRNIHSGGDVFTCGADLSALFHSQHNQETLNKFQIYRVN